ncbi:viperin family antiviral radical SAM protein [uncultured Methanomethylovorans sp.]|uniref:viperin family antiviral radical SAM protein n=1 Tax=uncultured Methanomethylovorans sp. TaxID=183759 RepID=UPI002AA75853|nr:viperin family antiviral radical SAM protein [uncultured Methanomethylovorans sp.]
MYDKHVRSINWHITDKCNYHCAFCFSRRLGEEITNLEDAVKVLEYLKSIGIQRINFAGGEPMLHPLVFDLVRIAKEMGFVTSIVSNGYYLNQESIKKLSPWLDWIGLSVDSCCEEIHFSLGRGNGDHIRHIRNIVPYIHENGIRLKINTVVTKLNFREDMKPLIKELNPIRWKILQALPIKGQNEKEIENYQVSELDFDQFVKMNKDIVLSSGDSPVFETNDDMVDSYLMIGPNGSVIKNSNMEHTVEDMKINGIEEIDSIVDWKKYSHRGGDHWISQ